MKVLLYTEGLKTIGKSGLGKAIKHQMKALDDVNIEYTTNSKDDYDILHINTYFLKSYLLARKAKRQGKKIVYHAHSTEEDFKDGFIFCRQISPLFKKWLIKCYSMGDVLVTPTPYSKRLLEGYGMNKKIYAISNGIELDFFKKDKKMGEKFREKYNYTKDDKVIIGIGLYIERKGIVDFVELARRLPEYKFIWFGYSPLAAATKPVREAVNTKLPNLTFAGYVEQDMILEALNGCDLYLFPTLEETEGIPIIEACACGANAIIRDIPIFEGWLQDGVNVYKAKDVDEFEVKIKQFMAGKLKPLGDKSYQVAVDRDLNKIGTQLKEVYTDVLKMPKRDKTKEEKITGIRTLGIILASIMILIASIFSLKDIKFEKEEYKKMLYYMDTYIEVTVYTNSEAKANEALEGVEEIYKKYDSLTDRYDTNSELYYINNNTDDSLYLEIDPELYNLIEYSLSWRDKTNGLFDINIGPIVDVWKKYRDQQFGVPTPKELNDAKASITNIELKDNKVVNNNVNIDLGAISKGYATEKSAEYLESIDVDSYLINAGGNVVAGDYYKSTGKYKIGIASPFKDNDSLLQIVQLTNKAVVTSGSYQRYYEYDGITYGHIIDPNTLYPANHMVGVTVIADSSALADILSTTLFLMPIEEGMEFIKDYEGVEVVWCYLDSSGNEQVTRTHNFHNYE